MDEIRQFIGGLLDLLEAYLALWGRGVAAVGEEFDLGISTALANLIGFFLGVVSLLAFLNVVFKWDRKGNQAQAIILRTAETPDQVVAKDRSKFLMMMLRVSIVILILAVLISSRG